MTNVYNGLIDNLEYGLGRMKRHDTEHVLRGMDTSQTPEELIRTLHDGNPHIRDWKEGGEVPAEHIPEITEAQAISRALIEPILTRDTRTGFFTRAGGNALAGLADIWVRQDMFNPDSEVRSAYIVEYDLVNMEAVMMAAEKMIGAIDEERVDRSKNSKTSPQRLTDGYIRIVNGLVYEAFADALKKHGVENVGAHLHPVRLSNGDEFRLVVTGLDDEDITKASRDAQQRVERFVSEMGFDALPHLKYLKDLQKWNHITGLKDVEADPELYKAFKYGGAGIKIGAAELGQNHSTADIEHTLDIQIHASREERAKERAEKLDAAIAHQRDGEQEPVKVFNSSHRLAQYGMGTVLFADPQSFKRAIHVCKNDEYGGYYARPEVDSKTFPYPMNEERRHAYPYRNPADYIDEFTAIISDYVTLTNTVKARLTNEMKYHFLQASSCDTHEELAEAVLETVQKTLEASYSQGDMQDVLKARAQFEEKRTHMHDALATYANTLNPYESFDLTRKRILDREADRLHLSAVERDVLFYAPLELLNARHEAGYCLSGRLKQALEVFQANDKEARQFSYIGLSSFAGLNEVNSAFGRSVNEHICRIAAGELKKRFGNKALDFAYVVDSGRLNVLTHGIPRSDLISALSAIEVRVDREINQQPIGELFTRYRIFREAGAQKAIVPHEEYDKDITYISAEVAEARAEHGEHTPLVFSFTQSGEVASRLLTDEEREMHRAAIDAGKTLFLEQPKENYVQKPPPKVVEYLKSVGYVDDAGELDLGKPLAMLPNPKHKHEHGARAVTAYVELLGRSPRLADQRKDELYRLVNVKKRNLYEPGRGYEVAIPVEAMPNFTAPDEEVALAMRGAGHAANGDGHAGNGAIGDGK